MRTVTILAVVTVPERLEKMSEEALLSYASSALEDWHLDPAFVTATNGVSEAALAAWCEPPEPR